MSDGQPSAPGIDVVEPVQLGGIRQWISVRSADVHNPLLLFLHGGPGTAQLSFARTSQQLLHSRFLVVNWDQRGAGRSWSRSLRREDMTIERFVADAEELAEALLARFGQQQLYLVGHSWGSIVGTLLAQRRPDLIRAYVGVGQVADMQRGEEVSYWFTLHEALRRGHQRAVRQLEQIGPPPYADLNSAGIQRRWLSRFHGSTFEGGIWGTLLRNVSLRDLRPLDLFRFVAGAVFSLSTLEEKQNAVNLIRDVPDLAVPVHFCLGRRDFTIPSELAAEYAAVLRAPGISVTWFERSGHLPMLEEPEVFANVCLSLLEREPADGARR